MKQENSSTVRPKCLSHKLFLLFPNVALSFSVLVVFNSPPFPREGVEIWLRSFDVLRLSVMGRNEKFHVTRYRHSFGIILKLLDHVKARLPWRRDGGGVCQRLMWIPIKTVEIKVLGIFMSTCNQG